MRKFLMKFHVAGFMILAAFLIAGCGQPTHDPNTITVWHWMTDRQEAFAALAERYRQETGMAVHFQLFSPSDVYSQKIAASAQAGILPDIFGVLDKKVVLGDFIQSGFVADLTGEFDADQGAWKDRFFDQALAASVFEEGNFWGVPPGIYGVPLDITTIQMVYNKEILEKAGVTALPETFEEFLDAAGKIRGIGITPFVSGWGEIWLVDCFASNYALNIMGQDKILATYRGDVPYTDPDWIRVFTVFQMMAGQGVIDDGIVIKTNKFAEQDFARGRAAFAFNGSWGVNVYYGMNPDLSYGVMRPPPVSGDHPLLIWGGAGSSLMVNAASLNKQQSVAFLKWLTDIPQQQFLAEATKNLPANRHALAALPSQLADFGQGLAWSTHPDFWPLDEDVVVKERFVKGLQAIMIGEKTPLEAAREVQAAKEREIARRKRR